MKVKVGGHFYDSEYEPVMVILSEADKANILNMQSDATKYAAYPADSNPRQIEKWMEDV